MHFGYGRRTVGKVGAGTGFDAYALMNSASPYWAGDAKIEATGGLYEVACTQDHWSMEGRPIIREANLEQYRQKPRFVKTMEVEESDPMTPMYPNPFDELKKGIHQWGMSIDLNRCVGCSACMVACQSENNVPIVGKEQIKRGREMHWLRIDRYYSGRPLAKKGDPRRA
jgi:molybdopterin-containing oxidoreductase family iron-sulfur binding subunit